MVVVVSFLNRLLLLLLKQSSLFPIVNLKLQFPYFSLKFLIMLLVLSPLSASLYLAKHSEFIIIIWMRIALAITEEEG
jgi:hypothetical protein